MLIKFELSAKEDELFSNYKRIHFCPDDDVSKLVKSCFIQFLQANAKLKKSHYWKNINIGFCEQNYPNFTNEHFDVLCYMAGWIGSENPPIKKIINDKVYFWILIAKIIKDLNINKDALIMILTDLENAGLIYSTSDSYESYFRMNPNKMIRILESNDKNNVILDYLFSNQNLEPSDFWMSEK